MKTKLKSIFIITIFVFTMLPYGFCSAAEPGVTREYISRMIGGVRSEEEKLFVNYDELRVEQELCMKFSFYDQNGSLVEEYETELSGENLFQDKMFFKYDALKGTEYVEIEISGDGIDIICTKLPLKI